LLLSVSVGFSNCCLFHFSKGRPRGFGHIDFVSADEAIRAVNELGGVSLLGRELRVDHARRKEDGDAAAPRREFSDRAPRQSGGGAAAGGNRDHSIFLGNLAWEVTPELVEEMLDDVLGPNLFLQVRLATDRETGRPRGFGHVDFKDAESAERALVELNGLEVMGRQLRVDMAQRRVPGEGGEGGGGGYGGGGGGRGGGGGGRGGGGGGGYRGGGEDIGSFGAF
jgi:nucleolin